MNTNTPTETLAAISVALRQCRAHKKVFVQKAMENIRHLQEAHEAIVVRIMTDTDDDMIKEPVSLAPRVRKLLDNPIDGLE